MKIQIDPTTLAQRLTDFASVATEQAIIAKNSTPARLADAAINNGFYDLSVSASNLQREFTLVTRGEHGHESDALVQASRSAAMLFEATTEIANSGVGRVDSHLLEAVGNDAANAAVAAAKLVQGDPVPHLKFGTPVAKLERPAGELLDMSGTTRDIIGALSRGRGQKDSVIVTGPPGSGLSSALVALSDELQSGRVPNAVRDVDFVAVDAAKLREGASKDDVANRLKATLDSASQYARPTIVAIDNLHDLADSVDAGLTIRNAIQDSKGALRVVGFASDEYAPKLLKDKRLGNFAQVVQMPRSSSVRAQEVLDTKWAGIEVDSAVQRSGPEVGKAVVTLAETYLGSTGRDLSGLVVDVARGAAADVAAGMFAKPARLVELDSEIRQLTATERRLSTKTSAFGVEKHADVRRRLDTTVALRDSIEAQWQQELPIVTARTDAQRTINRLRAAGAPEVDPELAKAVQARDAAQQQLDAVRNGAPGVIKDVLDPEAVVQHVSKLNGIPAEAMAWDNAAKYRDMVPTMKRGLVGQDHLLEAIAGPVQVWKAGEKDPDRPVAVIVMAGPSQVGKTEAAYQTAEFLYGDRNQLLTIAGGSLGKDPEGAMNMLIGSKSGFVGSDKGALLTDALRENEFKVALLDEMDKAPPGVFSVLLETGNSGNIIDGMGQPVSVKNTVLLVSGNWLLKDVNEARMNWSKLSDAERKVWVQKLKDAWKDQGIAPEVFNRITNWVVVNSISEDMVRGIADMYLDKRAARLAKSDVALEVGDDVKDYLARVGNDPSTGGSEVKRIINREIAEKIVQKKNEGEIRQDDTVRVGMGTDADGNEHITFEVLRP